MKLFLHSRNLIALTAVLLLTLSACSRQSSQTDTPTAASAPVANAPASASSAAPPAVSNEQPDDAKENGVPVAQAASRQVNTVGPQIKGIALGNSPDEVRQALSALLPVGSPCQYSTDAVRVVCENTAQRLQGSFTYESGKLTGFKFYSAFTGLVFGQMPFNDFTKNFMTAYNIPRMDPAQDNPALSQYLRYRDDNGWEVGIYPDNTFYVKSVATANQQAKSFN
ncbi:hypothetical protein IST4116A_01266 [Burkholderia cenocepacia]|uniref:hypothetical protein n=1 Tax=Burkholderia cenocepacia TaxID=95486 RepID=UPI00199E41B2|nr:hypothetical protein [Burkholderia cenocepacia]MBR7965840.1 hypothetical protein [Burkholderia cenocepacia]CAB5083732.1 hypothetical protein IST4116B_01258 [Burkholderia cenocepacia]CAB5084365.1 hypothetical protein IST4134_01267 [Burkholderia cenocepacia]CAB5087838.1 hypothetical protein IST4112_01263 [Burkholderia cenocepacia]CAB5088382.1 hypothetical protein IST4113_01265 [Burkholderia cenocepacia]